MTPLDPSADEASGAAHEGSDPAGAEASDKSGESSAGEALRPPEGGSFAQLGLDGAGSGEAPGIDTHGRLVGAAEGLPPERAEDLNQIAADDVGATAMAERAAGKAKPGDA
ncbi:MAG: hypothetical protein JSR45_04985 [Proteobacteria bacterium]|nr:hypothetical protein [Pseudomonadota bacterium]